MNFKELVASRGKTCYRVAKDSNISLATISQIATGKRKKVRLETAMKISKVLDIDVTVLYECIGDESYDHKN